MSEGERRYPLAYNVERNADLTKGELEERNLGGADAIVISSIMFRQDGSRSQVSLSLDGRTGEDLSGVELFKTWALMAHSLAEYDGLHTSARALCRHVHESVRAAVLAAPADGGE